MSDYELCSFGPDDLTSVVGEQLLALNNAHARELSWLEPDRLRHLVSEAFLALRIGNVDAFLLAFDQDADYDSPDFLWFRARHARFVYIDRVVVAPQARRRGHARRLYNTVVERASGARYERIVCEVNFDPPNRVSDAFHAASGFVQVGMATHHGGGKTVRDLSRALH
jgi:predicted GNAT superfamily acetyltransferase